MTNSTMPTFNCSQCGRGFRPEGFGFGGSFYRTNAGGGAPYFFCSGRCATEFDTRPGRSDLLPWLVGVMECAGVTEPQETAKRLAECLVPVVERLPDETDGTTVFRITPSRHTDILHLLSSGDQNIDVHVGDQATAHTLTRIGMFAVAVSLCFPSQRLVKIDKIIFTRPLPSGAPAIIKIAKGKTKMGVTPSTVTSFLMDGSSISRPTTVTTASRG